MTEPDKGGGILDKLGDIIAEKVLPKLVELLWPRLEMFVIDVLMPKLVAMFPLFAASVAKAVIDQIPGVDLVRDVVDIAEGVRGDVNVAIPDFDIPVLSDVFDLSEFLRGRK